MDDISPDAREISLGGNLVVLRGDKDLPIQATPPDSEHRGSTLTKLHIAQDRLDVLHKSKQKLVVVFPYNETKKNPDSTATIEEGYRAILVEPSKGLLQKDVKAKTTELDDKKLKKVMKELNEGSEKLLLAPIMEANNSNLVVDDTFSTEKVKEFASGTPEEFLTKAGEATIHRKAIVTGQEALERTQEGIQKYGSPDRPVETPPTGKPPKKGLDSTSLSMSSLDYDDEDVTRNASDAPSTTKLEVDAEDFFKKATTTKAEKEPQPQDV